MIKEVRQIKYADSFLSEDAIFKGGQNGKMLPIIFSFYLLKTENRLILVDTGCDTTVSYTHLTLPTSLSV